MRKCPVCNRQVKNCDCRQFAQTCRICRKRNTLDGEGNCTCCPLCGESKTEGRCSGDTTCQSSNETEMAVNSNTMPIPTLVQEPPNIKVLEDRSHLENYITALKRWSNLAKATGTKPEFHADIVLDRAFRTYPELYMEMSDNFCDTLKDDGEGIQKIIAWLKTKFGMNKHADMVKVLNQFFSTTRTKNESLIDYLARFEKSYADVKKTGESLSSTCRAILLRSNRR